MSQLSATEEFVRGQYRIAQEPGWQVQKLHRGEWRVVAYCGNEDAAKKSLQKHIARALLWRGMSDEDRMASILR